MGEATQKPLVIWAYNLVVSVVIVPGILAYFQLSPLYWIAGGVCSLAILRAWEKGYLTPATWTAEGRVERGTTRTVVAFVALVVIAGGVAAIEIWGPPLQTPPRERPPEANPPAPVADHSMPVPQPQLQSTNARVIYRCPHLFLMPEDLDRRITAYDREMQILGDTFGFKAEMTKVLGGIKMVVTPTDPDLQRSMRPVMNYSLQIRYLDDRTIVVYSPEVDPTVLQNPLFAIVLAAQVTPKSQTDLQTRNLMKRLPGVTEAECNLF